MWFLKNLFWLVIMILVVGFAILNMKETVSAVNLPGHVYTSLPANVVLFISFVLGMVAAFVLVLVQVLRSKSAMGRMSRENEELKKELSQLRNLPLTDLKIGRSGGGS
jgi:uncharacterized integral membrane protein